MDESVSSGLAMMTHDMYVATGVHGSGRKQSVSQTPPVRKT